MSRLFFVIVVFLFFTQTLLADNHKDDDGKDSLAYSEDYFTQDFLMHIDSMLSFFQPSTFQLVNDNKKANNFNFAEDSVPIYPLLTYEYRLAKINEQTPIRLDYNEQVQHYIDLYTIRQRKLFAKIIGRSKYYFPLFEEQLEKYNIPLELKYLVVIESALNPEARSPSGAVGLWQFMYNTGKILGLKINSFVDERRDPYKSTEAACKYLSYLYRTFNDWQLAIAAYNGGPGVVRDAIEKSGGITDFWKLRKYLPKQTQSYVPAFIAVNYAFNYIDEHNVTEKSFKYNFSQVDTIKGISGLYFSKIASQIDIPVKTLKLLNPEYKKQYIPKNKKNNILVLPKEKKQEFLNTFNSQEQEYKSTVYSDLPNSEELKVGRERIIHVVKHGEYFHQLALEYNCTIKNIKDWNNLNSNSIYSSQKLIIYVQK